MPEKPENTDFLACWNQAPSPWQQSRCETERSVPAGWEDVLWGITDRPMASTVDHTQTYMQTYKQVLYDGQLTSTSNTARDRHTDRQTDRHRKYN